MKQNPSTFPKSLWLISLICILVLIGRLALFTPINHDIGWYVFSARQWLDGAELYTDVMEVNPPAIYFITAPVIWLRRLGDARL